MIPQALTDDPDRRALAAAVARAVREAAELRPSLRVVRVSLIYADDSRGVYVFPTDGSYAVGRNV